MAVNWQIRHTPPSGPAVTKSPKAWGVRNDALALNFAVQAPDTLTVTLARAMDDDAVWPYGSAVDLLRDGVRVFAGRVVRAPRRGDDGTETIVHELEGPWWWLEHTTFEQDWNIITGLDGSGDFVLTPKPLTHLIIGTDISGAKISAAGTVAAVFAFLTERLGAPLALGDCDLAQVIPCVEMRDVTCAEVLQGVLRWFPQVQAVWDYAAATPTLHLRKRASLGARAWNPAVDDITGVSLTPLEELKPAAVMVRYQRTNTSSGGGGSSSVTELIEDVWPVGADPYAPTTLRMLVQLQGSNETTVSQKIKTELIQTGSKTWWAKKVPWLKDANVTAYALVTGSNSVVPEEVDATGYDRELVEGALADWMGKSESAAVASADIRFTRDGRETIETFKVRLRTTNAGTGTYSTVTNFTAAEAVPVGLAKRYYEETSALQYEGDLTLAFAEWDGEVHLGTAVNLAGFAKRPEWATMRALCTAQSVDLATGRTTLTLGPARHLSPADWVTLARPWRGRDSAVAGLLESRKTGKAGGAATPLPDKPAKSEVTSVATRPGAWTIAALGANEYAVAFGWANGVKSNTGFSRGLIGAKEWIFVDVEFAAETGVKVKTNGVQISAGTDVNMLNWGSEKTRRILIGTFTPGVGSTPPLVEQMVDANLRIERADSIASFEARTRGVVNFCVDERELVVKGGMVRSISSYFIGEGGSPWAVLDDFVLGLSAGTPGTPYRVGVKVTTDWVDGGEVGWDAVVSAEWVYAPVTDPFWIDSMNGCGSHDFAKQARMKDMIPEGCCPTTLPPTEPEESTGPGVVDDLVLTPGDSEEQEPHNAPAVWQICDFTVGTDKRVVVQQRHTGDIHMIVDPVLIKRKYEPAP